MRTLDESNRSAPGHSIDTFRNTSSIRLQHPMTARRLPEKEFLSHAPGYWKNKNVSEADWNSHVWQLKNRVTTLAGLEEHLVLSPEERAGVLLSGNKLAMAI